MVLSDRFVYADVFELAEAVLLVDLNECDWSNESVSAPEVFDENVCDCYGFCSSRDADTPLS